MTEPVVQWPLTGDQRALVVQLAELIRRFGAERFATAALVRADARDFPDPWEPTLAAVHAVIYRLCWLAYFDPEIVVEDRRPAKPPDYKMLTRSELELASVDHGVVTFHVGAIGNDDVAGLLSHRIGQAFLELAPGDPFRSAATEPPTETAGSVAAVYLGLGVLVANSAMYRRHASRIVARSVITEELIEKVGGLSIVDATLLLAVQDLLRDDYQDALTTLHKPQAEWVAQWTAVLEPHEDELRALLELADREPVALARPPTPRRPPAVAERNLRRFNDGRTTFRVPTSNPGAKLLGFVVGGAGATGVTAATGFLLPIAMVAFPVLMFGGIFVARKLGGKAYKCADPDCSVVMKAELPTCPRCGGSIAETIAHERDRLERLEELEGSPELEDDAS